MKRRASLPFLPGLFPCAAVAADLPARGGASVDMLQWILGLSAVLLALLVFAWALRRLGHFSRLEPGSFRVLAALSLGSRERVVLVQAGTKQLVLGVAPGSVKTLCVLEGEDSIRLEGEAGPQQPFAQQFKTLLSGRKP